jgi:hypothetical protein
MMVIPIFCLWAYLMMVIPIFCLWAYLMMVNPEANRAYYIIYYIHVYY